MDYSRIYRELMASGSKEKFPLSHGHHIIPKHIGGTDDEWNFVFLTVRQHALAHRLLWKRDGRWQDKLAWQGLSNMIEQDELIRQVQSNTNKGKVVSEETRKKISDARKGKPSPRKGVKLSAETRAKLSLIATERNKTRQRNEEGQYI